MRSFYTRVSIILPILFLSMYGFSQDLTRHNSADQELTTSCGITPEAMQEFYEQNPEAYQARIDQIRETQQLIENNSDRNGGVLTIPVVFHVIHNGTAVGVGANISEAQIQSALDVINEEYSASSAGIGAVIPAFQGILADMEIQFCLAKRDPQGNPTTGITRQQGSQPMFTLFQDEALFKQGVQWDATRYLNIFTVFSDLTTLGTGFMPGAGNPLWQEGIAVDFAIPGRPPQNPNIGPAGLIGIADMGRVLAHEIGHYFFLDHPAGPNGGQGCIPENGATCNFLGDRCCDTPPQDFDVFTCNVNRVSCGSQDNMQNQMQVNADMCRLMFTNDQKTLARTFIQNARPGLFGGNQCEKVFRAINIGPNFATLDWSGTLEAVSYNVQWWIIGQPVGSAGMANTGNNATQFNPPGLIPGSAYGWQVQAVFANGTTGPWEPPLGATFRTNAILPPGPCPFDQNEVAVFGPYLQPGGGQGTALICPAADIDRFVIMDQFPERTRMYINLTGVSADYDMDLVDANTNVILAQALTPGVVNETIIFDTPQAGQNYYVFVYAKPGQPVTNIPYFVGLQQIPLSANPPRMADPSLFEVKVYPNPNSGYTTLSFVTEKSLDTRIDLYDATGRKVSSEMITGEGIQTTDLDMFDLAPGIYRLDIINDEFRTVRSIVRE